MNASVMETQLLQPFLMSHISTSKVRVLETGGNITLIPVADNPDNSGLIGMFEDLELSSEDFSLKKQEEKELEYAREKRLHAPQLSKKQIENIKEKYPSISHLVGKFREV